MDSKYLIQYLKAVGVSTSDIDILKKETLPEGYDIKGKAAELLELKSRIDPETKKKIEKEAVAKQIPIFRTTLLQKVNKTFGFGLSRSDIEKMEEEDFFKKGTTVIESKISEAGTTGDEELRKKLKNTELEVVDLNEQIEKVKKEAADQVQQEQTKYRRKEYETEFRKAYNNEANKVQFSKGIPSQTMHRLHGDYVREILAFAKIDFENPVNDSQGKPSFAVTDLEGNDLPNFDKNGKWKTLNDVVNAVYQREGVLKVSNGGEHTGNIIQNLGQYQVTDKTSQRMRDKIKRLEQAEGSKK